MCMKTIVYGLALGFALYTSVAAKAQSDSVRQNEKDKAEFKLGVYYNTNLNYYGRTDSLKSSGFFPLAEVWLNKNFYINAAPIFVNNSVTSFDYAGTVTTIGFRFNNNNKFAGNI